MRGGEVSVHDYAVVRLDTILSNSNAATTKKDVQKENSKKKPTVVWLTRKQQKYQRNTRARQHKQKFSDSVKPEVSANLRRGIKK